jgi:outer membrane protein assembly factor BamB
VTAPDYGEYELGYTPGDPVRDRYMYVYPDVDGTRRVVRKIGAGLGLTWSLAWDGTAIWTSTLGGNVMRLDPTSGAVLRQFGAPDPQTWGMAYGDGLLWLSDFAEKKVYGLDPQNGAVVKSFPSPDPVGGLKGLAWGNGLLYGLGWTSPVVYAMNANG